jgi:hypothetical protein
MGQSWAKKCKLVNRVFPRYRPRIFHGMVTRGKPRYHPVENHGTMVLEYFRDLYPSKKTQTFNR